MPVYGWRYTILAQNEEWVLFGDPKGRVGITRRQVLLDDPETFIQPTIVTSQLKLPSSVVIEQRKKEPFPLSAQAGYQKSTGLWYVLRLKQSEEEIDPSAASSSTASVLEIQASLQEG